MIAKAPVAGRSKTRLTPPCTPAQAAELAAAALEDTLHAVAAAPAARRILVLDGRPGPWLPPGFELTLQGGGGLGRRLAGAFAHVTGPALLVGMDTPQVTAELLGSCAAHLQRGAPSVLGAALDGGYWAIGLAAPDPRVFERVPMSSADTCARQRARLEELGLAPVELPALRDVDTIEDARMVAAEVPASRFGQALAACERSGEQPAA